MHDEVANKQLSFNQQTKDVKELNMNHYHMWTWCLFICKRSPLSVVIGKYHDPTYVFMPFNLINLWKYQKDPEKLTFLGLHFYKLTVNSKIWYLGIFVNAWILLNLSSIPKTTNWTFAYKMSISTERHNGKSILHINYIYNHNDH